MMPLLPHLTYRAPGRVGRLGLAKSLNAKMQAIAGVLQRPGIPSPEHGFLDLSVGKRLRPLRDHGQGVSGLREGCVRGFVTLSTDHYLRGTG
jgi:hypothetical protein